MFYLNRLLESSRATCKYLAPVPSWLSFTAVRNSSGTAVTCIEENICVTVWLQLGQRNHGWYSNDQFVDPVHNTIIYGIKFFLPIICGGNKRCKSKIKFEKKTPQFKCTTTKELYSSGTDIKTRIIWSEIQTKGIYSNVSALGSKRKIKEPSSTSSSATSNYVLQITLTLCFRFFL